MPPARTDLTLKDTWRLRRRRRHPQGSLGRRGYDHQQPPLLLRLRPATRGLGPRGALFAENIHTTVRLSNGEVTDAQEPYLDFFLERYADAHRIGRRLHRAVIGTAPPPASRTPSPPCCRGRHHGSAPPGNCV